MGTVTFTPELQRISEQARPYPAHLLPEGGTGLCLFSAAFLGWNDAIHMARRGMTTTCVDLNQARLDEMEAIYPADWTFHVGDAWHFANRANIFGKQWDAVSADTFTGYAETASLGSLKLWCSLARSLVTVTCSNWRQNIKIPDGWHAEQFQRSSEVNWLVLTR